jgi:MFS family permease
MTAIRPPRRVRKPSSGPKRKPASTPKIKAVPDDSGISVLQNRPFLLLWLAQLSTQVGGNMVIYGLTIIITASYVSRSAVSALLLSFLVPAILFSAVAGVFVDRVDKRVMLLVTNVLRGFAFLGIWLVGNNLLMLYLLMVIVSTLTTFFGPAEASMIPILVPRGQLLAANGLFTLTMNVAFALGFALIGPFLVAIAGAHVLILLVAALYFVAAAFCWTLPATPPPGSAMTAGDTVADAERAVQTMVSDFVEGITYIREHHNVGWSLSYLFITGALVGVLGVLGPGFAQSALELQAQDFGLIVLPLGLGIVTGILVLNSYGRYLPRRRTIETGIVFIGVLMMMLSFASPVAHFLEDRATSTGLSEASNLLSVMSMVMGIAFFVGASYVVVAISAQTQLQEELPEDVRGRVFGVLNMLVSVASLAPIVVVGPIADVVGIPPVILVVGIIVCGWGLASFLSQRHLGPEQATARAPMTPSGAPVDPLTVAVMPNEMAGGPHRDVVEAHESSR